MLKKPKMNDSMKTYGFPGGSDGKVSICNAGDPGSIPGLGRSPGEGNDNPLQYSCLENPMDRGAWLAIVHRVAKSWTRLGDFTFFLSLYEDLQGPSRTNTKKNSKNKKKPDVLFIIGDWNAKVASQEITGETGKFGIGVQNEARQRLTEFCQENELVITNTLFQQLKTRLHMDITRWSILKSD